MKKIFALVLLFFFASFHAQADDQVLSVVPQVERVTIANPTPEQAVLDAKTAAQAKDYRFMMTYGITTDCPGITMDGRTFSMIKKYGLKGMVGTNAPFDNEFAKKLNDQLILYAKKYNTVLLSIYKNEME